jgi:hypothetical protein
MEDTTSFMDKEDHMQHNRGWMAADSHLVCHQVYKTCKFSKLQGFWPNSPREGIIREVKDKTLLNKDKGGQESATRHRGGSS